MDMKLELVPIPGSRCRAREGRPARLRGRRRRDPREAIRVVQLTPPGSACSMGWAPASVPTTAGNPAR